LVVGLQEIDFTGDRRTRKELSSTVWRSQTQTTWGNESHLVARKRQSKDQAIAETPVGGPERPPFSKVLWMKF